MSEPYRRLPEFSLRDAGPFGRACLAAGAHTFRGAAALVARLPYGRPDAGDPVAVLREQRGTCSSKHVLLARLSREHGRVDVELVLGVYLMNGNNTPGVGPVLARHGLASVPEAHCYLRYRGQRVDCTGLAPGRTSPLAALLGEEPVEPDALAARKAARHRAVIHEWAAARGRDPRAVWAAREACIAALSAAWARPSQIAPNLRDE